MALVALFVRARTLDHGSLHSKVTHSIRLASRVSELSRLQSLPLLAQSVVSGALGAGTSNFLAARAPGGWQLAGGGVSAQLGAIAVDFRSEAGSVSLRLSGVGRGPQLGTIGGRLSVVEHGNRVVYRRPGLQEWFAAGPLGVEQGFTITRRPAGALGPVTVALRLGGSLLAVGAGSEVRFVTRSGGLAMRYGGLTAVDARGVRLPAKLVLGGGRLLLRVDDHGARYPLRIDPFIQQGTKLTGTGESGPAFFGYSAALSGDGNTALVGAYDDDGGTGAVWVFTRSGGVWTQQGPKLVGDCQGNGAICANEGTGETGNGFFGQSVALSADGNTALIGADDDAADAGAAWVFTRSGTTWSQQGTKLLGNCAINCSGPNGTGESGAGGFGSSVSLSSSGDTALIGADGDDGAAGAAWVFTRSGSIWSQQGAKLVGDCTSILCTGPNGTGEIGTGQFGLSVAVSGDGSTALLGAGADNGTSGAAWVFTVSGSIWSQQAELSGDCTSGFGCSGPNGTGEIGAGDFGSSVALSADGSTGLVGSATDNRDAGAAWVFTRAGSSWSQQGSKLIGDCTSSCGGASGTGEAGAGFLGAGVSLSADGNTALLGASQDSSAAGAVWAFARASSTWSQQGAKLIGDCTSASCTGPNGTGEVGSGQFGSSVAVSGDASTALIGGEEDNGSVGAAWPFLMQTPAPTATATAISSSLNPSTVGQAVTFTATVTPTPDGGTVSFSYGGTTICAAVALSAGAATCQTTPALNGTYPVIATYSGDAAYAGSASPGLMQAVAGFATTTTVRSSVNPVDVGQPVTYTATVTPAPSGGTVSFTDASAGSGCGTATISAGVATCTTSYSAIGSHLIIAVYSGHGPYGASDTNSLTETVTPAAPTATLTSSANPSVAGQPVTFTAQLTPAPDGGSVRFANLSTGGAPCPSAALSVSGEATCTTTLTSPGADQITAFYAGDANYSAALTGLTQTVQVPLVIALVPSGQPAAQQATVTVPSCGATQITIETTQQNVPGASSLTVSASGDTTGLHAALSSSSLPYVGSATLTLTSTGDGTGTGTYLITATNGSYPPATATLTVNHTGSVVAQGLYVTQGTQVDDGHLIPSGPARSGADYVGVDLVAGKKTAVRLYADAPTSPAGVPDVVVRLYGYQGGHPLPGSPLSPDSGAATTTVHDAHAGGAEIVSDQELVSNANAYTFTLPASWNSGPADPYTIDLTGTLKPYGSGRDAACTGKDSFTLKHLSFLYVGGSFNEALTPVAMEVGNVKVPPVSRVFRYVDALTPLPDIAGNDFYDPPTLNLTAIANETNGPCGLPATAPYPGSTSAGSACNSQKNSDTLGLLESSVHTPKPAHIVGVTLGTAYGLTNGVPGNYSVVDGSGDRPLTSVAHELFHQFGLQHASSECGGGQDGDQDDGGQISTPWLPLAPPPITAVLNGNDAPRGSPLVDGTGQLNGIGLDMTSKPYRFVANNVPQTVDGVPTPETHSQIYDLMSYCTYVGGGDGGDWLSPRNWDQLIANFGIHPASAASAASAAGGGRSAGSGDRPLAATARVDPARLSVLGFVTSAGLDITSVGPQVGPTPPSGGAGASYTLIARGSGNRVIANVPMAATSGGHIDGLAPGGAGLAPGEGPLVQITGEVPAAGVQRIQVAHGASVIGTRVRPAQAPQVKVLAPRPGARVGGRGTVLVRWKATNPEHLALTVYVDYSSDAGRTWSTIFGGPNTGRAALPSFYFVASRSARLRVRVSDGFNQPAALSGRFVALGAPPEVTITTDLARGTPVAGDARLQLSGNAVDQGGQTLAGPQLRWFDGPFLLGTGAQISAAPLPPGVNHLRLVARDPTGRTASAGLTVVVSAVRLPFLRLRIPPRVRPRAGRLRLQGSSSIPATLTIGRHNFRLTGKPRTFNLLIAPGRGPLLLALSVSAEGITTPFAARITR